MKRLIVIVFTKFTIMTKYWAGFILFLLGFSMYGQNSHTDTVCNPDFRFIDYLSSAKQFAEAAYLLNQHKQCYAQNHLAPDTLSFLLGKIYYQQNLLESSIYELSAVTQTLDNYNQIQLLLGYELMQTGKYDAGLSVIKSVKPKTKTEKDLQNFQLSAAALLKQNLDEYEHYTAILPKNNNAINIEKDKLADLAVRIKNHNPKSPALAGMMSAILPGSGKMYTGKYGEGITAFLSIAILGAITYENFNKAGINNYKTITFGSMFGIFYAANIYGSVFSVKAYRDEFNQSVNHAILFNMHIPLRNAFPGLFR